MPIYEYKCSKCGHKIEVIQKMSDQPITVCEKCNGSMSKVISPAGLMFKGSGWYITDYSSKGKPPEEPSKVIKNQNKVSDKKEEKPAETATSTPEKKAPAT